MRRVRKSRFGVRLLTFSGNTFNLEGEGMPSTTVMVIHDPGHSPGKKKRESANASRSGGERDATAGRHQQMLVPSAWMVVHVRFALHRVLNFFGTGSTLWSEQSQEGITTRRKLRDTRETWKVSKFTSKGHNQPQALSKHPLKGCRTGQRAWSPSFSLEYREGRSLHSNSKSDL